MYQKASPVHSYYLDAISSVNHPCTNLAIRRLKHRELLVLHYQYAIMQCYPEYLPRNSDSLLSAIESPTFCMRFKHIFHVALHWKEYYILLRSCNVLNLMIVRLIKEICSSCDENCNLQSYLFNTSHHIMSPCCDFTWSRECW